MPEIPNKSAPRKSAPTAARAPVARATPARKAAIVAAKPVAAGTKAAVRKISASPSVAMPLDKSTKPKKAKLVRDSFTIPKIEYGVLDALKERALRINSPAKKSELLRAGIKALAAMSDAALLNALKAVPAIKTGRPSQA